MQKVIHAIYLNHLSYSDTSVILKVFSAEVGMCSFMIKGAKKKKGLMANLQPFHLLEISTNYNPEKELNFAKQIRLYRPNRSITLDIRKSTVAIFLTELMYRSIQEKEPNEELYRFLETAVTLYDEQEFDKSFHLIFLLQLSRYLGFYPGLPDRPSKKYFNLREGVFEFPERLTPDNLSEEVSRDLLTLLGTKFDNSNGLLIPYQRRKHLLSALVKYYEVQLDLREDMITSHKILEAVFEE